MSCASQSTFMPPDGASCWLCLEEGPDDSGAPLVRDCSCRGHSGFAHLACLVQYAESKSMDLTERGAHMVSHIFEEKFFQQCPNCKQSFQGDISYDMTKAQLAFIEREFKDVDRWNLIALLQRIVVLDGGKEEDRIEGEEISAKMLSLIDEMEKNSNLLDVILPVSVNKEIGRFNSEVGTKQCLEKAKYYLEKARDIFKTSEDCEIPWAVNSIEGEIAAVEARISGDSRPKKAESDLSDFRVGTLLASKLFNAYHTIEAS
eukprot:scaffold23173_cov168-Skeletonema_marinoi.AAC.1